ncbi:hypothetical protein [Williamsia deligens]|uniref:Head-to-tail adaptor n=1 Tax=Williamsia deligens TaxID=321325 RepID=A0ABW3GBS6_9NOCA|nr:hypothetical protein [Williamsia deligens]MCP2195616.1 hypothetical protein [Williamsia deligens]
MTTPLATIDALAARLGRTFDPETPDYVRAESALVDVSARARSVAEQAWTDPTKVPDAVVTVVLAAARRIFTNPDRYLSNMAGTFQATLVNGDFNGDIFLPGELDELRKHQPAPGIWVLSTHQTSEETS